MTPEVVLLPPHAYTDTHALGEQLPVMHACNPIIGERERQAGVCELVSEHTHILTPFWFSETGFTPVLMDEVAHYKITSQVSNALTDFLSIGGICGWHLAEFSLFPSLTHRSCNNLPHRAPQGSCLLGPALC